MAKKLTYEYVKNSFTEEGYALLSEEYVNSKSNLYFKCAKGHYDVISLGSWLAGHRCKQCSPKSKLSIERIRSEFRKEGYKLLTLVYKNNKQKLRYVCPNGHYYFITWHGWQKGYRCLKCSGKVRHKVEFIKQEFKKENYTLISTTYINSKVKLKTLCPNGHTYNVCWNDWTQGVRCPKCVVSISDYIEDIKASLLFEGYKLVDIDNFNSSIKLKTICPNGHAFETTWFNWLANQRCSQCPNKYINIIAEFLHSKGHKLISKTYVNNTSPLVCRCPQGHIYISTWVNISRTDTSCKKCIELSYYGETNPNWQGGISLEPYCEAWKDGNYKASIRKRDDSVCLNPQCVSKKPDDLTIHHIDYNKKNCHPSNLITVCRSCNGRANKDRKWHQSWYQAIMYRRYKYKY